MRFCVITVGIDSPSPKDHPVILHANYADGIKRLKDTLAKTSFCGDVIAWDNTYPEGSPSHVESPFAFKPYAFLNAAAANYDNILWLDCSICVLQPLDSLFAAVVRNGHVLFHNYHSVGEYCKDDALAPLGITRDESFKMPSCNAAALGLNLNDGRSRTFLNRWAELAIDGITFPGPKHSGVNGWPRTASLDPRVKGHRYDQTAASVIALKLGMHSWHSKQEFRSYFLNDRKYVRQLKEKIEL